MKGDFTRRSDDPSRHYSRVLKQQGRVDLDADWNEQAEIEVRRERTRSRDVVGRTGAPRDEGGFRVVVDDRDRLAVTRGRIYVDGILVSNESDDEPGAVPLDEQPELPGYDPDGDTGPSQGVHAVYLDVWDRHVTHVEDPGIKEPALDGPDTATRVQTVAQVRRTGLEGIEEAPPCSEVPRDWVRDAEPRLAARAEPGEETEDRCEPPAAGGYRGLENRLYRVEIHRGTADGDGPATFKWSRDNGAVLYRAVDLSPSASGQGSAGTITLERPARDDRLAVGRGDWVEILDRATELAEEPGVMARVTGEPNVRRGKPVLDLEVPGDQDLGRLDPTNGLKVRRWDQHGPAGGNEGEPLVEGTVPVREGEWIPLEKGVEVRFDPSSAEEGADGAYRTGDYWLVPARSGIGDAGAGDVLWPEWEGGAEDGSSAGGSSGSESVEFRPREGIRHHYCLLAVVRYDGEGWGEPRDCRPDFPPLTDLDRGSCCETVRPGENVQAAVDRVVGAGGGCVSLCRGLHRLHGPLRVTGDADLVLRGEGEATVVLLEDDGGDAGGIDLEGADGVAVESMFLAGEAPGGLVRIGGDGETGHSSRRIRLRDLTVLNAAGPLEATLPSAVQVGPADDVTVEGCRLAGAAGIAARWGETLPALPDLEMPDLTQPDDVADAGDDGSPLETYVSFDGLETGRRFGVGESFEEPGSGLTLDVEPAVGEDGDALQAREEAGVHVEDRGLAGGGGNEIAFDAARVSLAPSEPAARASFRVGLVQAVTHVTYSGFNLVVNGELRFAQPFTDLDGATVGGTNVRVEVEERGPGIVRGRVVVEGEITRLGVGGSGAVDDVRFFADASLPDPGLPPYGRGVSDLTLRDSAIRYRDAGVFSLRSEGWRLHRADVRPRRYERWTEMRASWDAFADAGDEASGPEATAWRLRQAADAFFRAPTGGVEGGGPGKEHTTAILAHLWRDSEVRDCFLEGVEGMRTWWWIRGGASGNRVRGRDAGLAAFWLHDASWRENRVAAAESALSLSGGYRGEIAGNVVRAGVGLGTVRAANTGRDLARHLRLAARVYGRGESASVTWRVIPWLMVEELVDLAGLRDVVEAVQALVDTVTGLLGRGERYPVTLLAAVGLLRAYGDDGAEREGALSEGAGVTLPVIDLAVEGNRVRAEADALDLSDLVPLGSLRVADNRAATPGGRGIRVRAHPLLANAALLHRWFRSGLAALPDGIVRLVGILLALMENRTGRDLGPAKRKLGELGDLLRSRIRGWLQEAETFLEADARIEENTVRSLRTGIESNLFQVSVARNHVTVIERGGGGSHLRMDDAFEQPATEHGIGANQKQSSRPSNSEILRVIRTLEGTEAPETPLASIGSAMREGAALDPRLYADHLAGDGAPLAGSDPRPEAAQVVASVGSMASDEELSMVSEELSSSLQGEAGGRKELLVRFVRGLQRYVDSVGILVHGAGGRIVENRVLVPEDADPESRALGGVQVSFSLARVREFQAAARGLGEMVGSSLESDPTGEETGTPEEKPRKSYESGHLPDVPGVSDTLVARNEIRRGVGHGVSVQGLEGLPDLVRDLRISRNEVRGMAGAGVLVGESALVAGLEVGNNGVFECGGAGGFSTEAGGIVVRTAVACALKGNQVVRCVGEPGIPLWGVEVEAVHGLRATDNEISANGGSSGVEWVMSGGLLLRDVYGPVQLNDNELLRNRGRSLQWTNLSDDTGYGPHVIDDSAKKGDVIPRALAAAVERRFGGDFEAAGDWSVPQASVQDNVVRAEPGGRLPTVLIEYVRELTFTGNSCRGRVPVDVSPAREEESDMFESMFGFESTASTSVPGRPLCRIRGLEQGIVADNLFRTGGGPSLLFEYVARGLVHGNVGDGPVVVAAPAVQHHQNVPAVQ